MASLRCSTCSERVRVMVVVLLVATLARIPPSLCRPLPSGSSDSTLWRSFTTRAQASSYHRLLLELEKSLEVAKTLPEMSNPGTTGSTVSYAEDMFTTMDYANPRSNDSGSSDDLSPPTP